MIENILTLSLSKVYQKLISGYSGVFSAMQILGTHLNDILSPHTIFSRNNGEGSLFGAAVTPYIGNCLLECFTWFEVKNIENEKQYDIGKMIIINDSDKKIQLHGHFLWTGFTYLRVTEPLREERLHLTIKSPGDPGTHLIDVGSMRVLDEHQTTDRFWNQDVINWLGYPVP